MHTWNDNKGDEWSIAITVETAKRVRSLVKIDLMEVVGGTLLERMARDPIFLADLLYAVCKPQADERGISDEQFGGRLGGDAIDDATTALLEELVDFFPRAKRAPLQALLEKTRELEGRVADHVLEKVRGGELDAMLETELRQMSGGSSTSPPASPASIPDR